MSYDVCIGEHSFNYTWNVSRLFYDHIPPQDDDCRGGLNAIDGKTGKQAAAILAKAFERINRTRHELGRANEIGEPAMSAKYDAPNGWGSLIGALLFLAQIMAACYENPRKRVSVF